MRETCKWESQNQADSRKSVRSRHRRTHAVCEDIDGKCQEQANAQTEIGLMVRGLGEVA